MAPKSFQAQLRAFENLTKKKMELIVKASAQDVFSAAQTPQPSVKETGGSFEVGKVPVDLGDLRRSFVSGINGQSVGQGDEAYILAITGAELGDTIEGGWTAEHAPAIEYGTDTIAPRAYMRTNAGRWQEFVTANARKAAAMRM